MRRPLSWWLGTVAIVVLWCFAFYGLWTMGQNTMTAINPAPTPTPVVCQVARCDVAECRVVVSERTYTPVLVCGDDEIILQEQDVSGHWIGRCEQR